MPMIPLDEPILVDPTVNSAWTDVDVSSYVSLPAGGITGVVLRIDQTSTANSYKMGLRKKGSTDTRYAGFYKLYHGTAMIGTEGGKFQYWVENSQYFNFYIVAYTTTGYTFFDNGVDKTPTTKGSWQDVDCAAEAPGAEALIFTVVQGSYFGIRKNGSSDDRHRVSDTYGAMCCHTAFIGCDSQVVEVYASVKTYVYLIGYVAASDTTLVMNLNATDVSLATTGAYADLAALPSESTMAIIEVIETSGTASYNTAIRKKGSTLDIYHKIDHAFMIVPCNADRLIEAKIANTKIDMFVIGYTTPPLSPVGGGIGIGDCMIF